eukprot:4883180-Ditylum_brightwellii.AAC.1
MYELGIAQLFELFLQLCEIRSINVLSHVSRDVHYTCPDQGLVVDLPAGIGCLAMGLIPTTKKI